MRILSVGYLSVDCLSQPKPGTHGRNKRKSYNIVFMMFFKAYRWTVNAFLIIFEFLFYG
jgi:hypothetical protein